MTEERKYVYMRRTQSGQGVKMRDGEIIYIASIRSLEDFLHGDKEFVAFMRFPYRQIAGENAERDILYTFCDKCGGGRFFRKISEDKWRCETCGTERTTTELIKKVKTILECD